MIEADVDGAQFQNVEFFVSDTKFSTTYNIPFVTESVNEFSPVFDNLPATVSIDENTPIVAGSYIFRAVATDDDSAASTDGQVRFIDCRAMSFLVLFFATLHLWNNNNCSASTAMFLIDIFSWSEVQLLRSMRY